MGFVCLFPSSRTPDGGCVFFYAKMKAPDPASAATSERHDSGSGLVSTPPSESLCLH